MRATNLDVADRLFRLQQAGAALSSHLTCARQLPGVWQLFAFICCQLAIFMASIQPDGPGDIRSSEPV